MANGTNEIHWLVKTLFVTMILAAIFCIGGFTGQQIEKRSWEDSKTEWENFSIESCDQLSMCNFRKDKEMDRGMNGLYFPSENYYCVWAKNRTFDQQEGTDRHEWCHFLVDNDKDHFCYEE